jgi:hypothetical protein
VWIIFYYAGFASNTEGRRLTRLTATAAASATVSLMSEDAQSPVSGSTTICRAMEVFSLSEQKTYYLQAWQNSGETLSVTPRLYAVRIC